MSEPDAGRAPTPESAPAPLPPQEPSPQELSTQESAPQESAPLAPPATGARRLSPLTPLVRAPIVLLAVLGGSWQSLLSGGIGPGALAVVALVLAGGAYGVASWLRTTYWIHDDELRIDTGVVSRQSRRIRIDRLQGIDIVQPLVARLVGLAELRFDTASGSGREGTLAFLPHREAVALRAQLLRRRDVSRGAPAGNPGLGVPGAGVTTTPEPWPGPPFRLPEDLPRPAPTAASPGTGPAGADPAEWPITRQPDRELARLDLGLLVASTLLSPTAVLFVLGGGALLAGSLLTGAPLFAGGVVPALIGTGIALFRQFSAAYGFVVSESEEGVAVRRGLTNLTSQTVPLPRVQGVVVSEPVMWRRFGWARLEVSVAGAAGADDATFSSSTLLPVGPREQVLWLARHVLEGEDLTTVPLVPVQRRARWAAPLWWRTLAFGQDARYAVSRRGWFTRRFDVVPQGKVQSVRVTQGPWQRRLGLATLHVDSPLGRVAVRADERDAAEARALAATLVERGRAARHAPGRDRPDEATTAPL
ncbi:PH domain-containing protein [Nocardioides sp. HDW12B]|uniref:PH domain-containing protein n=1 Tax=Nocardioides sp. HDW12B TaxID=2714939 RepID=UPI00140C036A|nr:PH domain-containing protein [Nocardioides sp. HDW12B]QIK65097.1 PH domain-containing protein [Nocardioides sp. HDW12B]